MPEDLTLSFLCWYPDPGEITLIFLRTFCERVLNLWIPLAVVVVDNPIVLIPALDPSSEGASAAFLYSWIVLVFATPT